MSSIWQIIKEGKEKLNTKNKGEEKLDDVGILISCKLQDEDILMFDKDVKEKKVEKVENKKVEPIVVRELPEWLTKSDISEIRKLKDYPIFELHEELIRLEKWLQPTPFDKLIRERVVEDIQRAFSNANFQAEISSISIFSFMYDNYFIFILLPLTTILSKLFKNFEN